MTSVADQSGAFGEAAAASVVPLERIESRIYLIRGQKVLLDFDLAELYGVQTKALNQAVKRNLGRFPDDFMFRLSAAEGAAIRSQIVTASRRNLRFEPYAFTEQGVAMLSGLLNSPRAIAVNVGIMRAFVRLRQLISSHTELARKLAALERKYDAQFKVVFDAIRELMSPARPRRRELGFHTGIAALRPSRAARKSKAHA